MDNGQGHRDNCDTWWMREHEVQWHAWYSGTPLIWTQLGPSTHGGISDMWVWLTAIFSDVMQPVTSK